MVAIAAQVPSEEIGSGYFQETHPEQLFRECSSYCELVSVPEQMPRVLEIAIRRAIAERCVCVLVIPGDIAQKAAVESRPHQTCELVLPRPTTTPPRNALRRVADLLNGSERVTLLCGGGCAGAHDAVVQLAGKLKAPIVHALGGKESLEWENPYDVGMTGLIGFSSGYYAMGACDALLMLGTDFPYRQFFPADATIVQVDLRPEAIGRRTRIDEGLIGDVGATVEALLPLLRDNADAAHLNASMKHYKKTRAELDRLATDGPAAGSIPSRSSRRRAGWRRTMRSSPATSACRPSGRRATSR